MNEHREHEVRFWRDLYKADPEKFKQIRAKDFSEKTAYFEELGKEHGVGLDLGCGLVSIFENRPKEHSYWITATDPLMDEYNAIYEPYTPAPLRRVTYMKADGEQLPFDDAHFDFVFCVNVIDHTPDPRKMASEIMRVLKLGGRLYFEVNFDDHLSPAHYAVWNEAMVREMFPTLVLERSNTRRNPDYPQSLYEAVYRKP